MLTDLINSKASAKKDIQGALLGLLLILGAYLILNTINPQLTNQTIKFQPIPKSPKIYDRPAVKTVDGQTLDQLSSDLTKGTDTCVKTNQSTAQSGENVLVTLNASSCSTEKGTAALNAFQSACKAKKGVVGSAGAGRATFSCVLPLAGVEQGKKFVSEVGQLRTPYNGETIGSEYIKQTGSEVVTNIDGACDNSIKNASAGQQKGQYTACVSTVKATLETRCKNSYGIYNASNISAVSCKVPTEVRDITSLTDAFAKYKGNDPNKKYDTLDTLTPSQEQEVCKIAGGTYYDILGSNNKCAI